MSHDITDSMIDSYPIEYHQDLQFARSIGTRMNFKDYADFYTAKRFLENRQFKSFLELGVLYGGGTLMFSRFLEPGGQVVGVDNLSAFDNLDDHGKENLIKNRITPLFDWVAKRQSVTTQFNLSPTTEWLLDTQQTFDVIHVDAGHTVEAFLRDVLLAYSRLNQNGILLLDDCSIRKDGTVRGSNIGWMLIRNKVMPGVAHNNERYGMIERNPENDEYLFSISVAARNWPIGL